MRLKAINEKYNSIADQTGIKAQPEKMRSVGASSGSKVVKNYSKPLENSGRSGILKEVNLNHIDITKDVINNVPFLNVSVLGEEGSIALQNNHKQILTIAKNLPPNTEVGFICDMKGNKLFEQTGVVGGGKVKLPDMNTQYLTIHNHPDGNVFSHIDINQFVSRANMQVMSVVGNNGKVYCLSKLKNYDGFSVYQSFFNLENKLSVLINNDDVDGYVESIQSFLLEVEKYGVKFNR